MVFPPAHLPFASSTPPYWIALDDILTDYLLLRVVKLQKKKNPSLSRTFFLGILVLIYKNIHDDKKMPTHRLPNTREECLQLRLIFPAPRRFWLCPYLLQMNSHHSLAEAHLFWGRKRNVSNIFILWSSEMQMEWSWTFPGKEEREILVGILDMCFLGIASWPYIATQTLIRGFRKQMNCSLAQTYSTLEYSFWNCCSSDLITEP